MDRRALRVPPARRASAANTPAAEAPGGARAAAGGGGRPPARARGGGRGATKVAEAACNAAEPPQVMNAWRPRPEVTVESAAALAVYSGQQLALAHPRAPADIQPLRVVVELL